MEKSDPRQERITNENRQFRWKKVCALLVGGLGWAALGWSQTCTDCHEQADGLSHSAHAQVECTSCHLDHEDFPHPEQAASLVCGDCHSEAADATELGVHGQVRREGNEAAPDCMVCHGDPHQVAFPGTTPFRREVIETCGMCHTEAEEFRRSVHGEAIAAGNREAPTCVGCHGEHAIQRPSNPEAPTSRLHVRETCAECHGDLALTRRLGLPSDRIVSFDASFHGLALRAGRQTVANCGSCHGIHDILPSSDPRSTIHPDNLDETCGACHPGAGTRFTIGPVHVVEGEGQAPLADLVRGIYLVLIPVVIGLMVLHNLGDWIRKAARRMSSAVVEISAGRELRMLPFERLQHALLAISFIVLTWTGFALKFPDQFWAAPLVAWESSWPVRGTVHRIAAVVFLAAGVLHFGSLLFSARLRERWKSFIPRRRDVGEAASAFKYNLGLGNKQPQISKYSYIEKAEYWAVIWGGVLMSITGVVLWANDFFLTYLPKLVMDVSTVIHYYEAVLAALAIVVWHFYFVIFDPDVYPMNMAWWTGYGPAKESETTLDSETVDEKPADAVEPSPDS